MGIQKLIPAASTASGIGKHKIPRYIYHLTSKDSYEKMLKSGTIKPSEDDYFGEGVFAIELSNFFKRWGKNKAWQDKNLMSRLLSHVSGTSNLCILKIPTGSLDKEQLVVRSQNKLMNYNRGVYINPKIKEYAEDKISKGYSSDDAYLLAYEKLMPKISDHIEFGVPAKLSKLYKQRKEAIEYIYPEEIPMTGVKKIGEVSMPGLLSSSEYDRAKPLRSIFTKLLKGTPEVKGAELLDC